MSVPLPLKLSVPVCTLTVPVLLKTVLTATTPADVVRLNAPVLLNVPDPEMSASDW